MLFVVSMLLLFLTANLAGLSLLQQLWAEIGLQLCHFGILQHMLHDYMHDCSSLACHQFRGAPMRFACNWIPWLACLGNAASSALWGVRLGHASASATPLWPETGTHIRHALASRTHLEPHKPYINFVMNLALAFGFVAACDGAGNDGIPFCSVPGDGDDRVADV